MVGAWSSTVLGQRPANRTSGCLVQRKGYAKKIEGQATTGLLLAGFECERMMNAELKLWNGQRG